MKILAVGDLHFKDSLGYADCLEDRRVSEKESVLSFIVDQAEDCEVIVFCGDQLNARNNSSSVLKNFVGFLERFKNKQVFIIAGN